MSAPAAAQVPDDAALHALALRCVLAARQREVRFATAESCTGGFVAHLVTNIPGASHAFAGGWVVYDDARKVTDLGVAPELLHAHGAVSASVAAALAEGARRRAGTPFAIATTGVAGPGGGTAAKPVGGVWFGVAAPSGVATVHVETRRSGRDENKRCFAARALELLAAAIEADPVPAADQVA